MVVHIQHKGARDKTKDIYMKIKFHPTSTFHVTVSQGLLCFIGRGRYVNLLCLVNRDRVGRRVNISSHC